MPYDVSETRGNGETRGNVPKKGGNVSKIVEFPPTSKLNVQFYGNQNSSIKGHHIEQNLNGLKVEEGLKANRLFILDHHDSLMPYLRRINEGVNKIYASRTLLLLQEYETLKPLAIELSLPHLEGDNFALLAMYTPQLKRE
ncbi:probable linoleate 9S-lipoxygenase 5 [Tanacetum coccineum]